MLWIDFNSKFIQCTEFFLLIFDQLASLLYSFHANVISSKLFLSVERGLYFMPLYEIVCICKYQEHKGGK